MTREEKIKYLLTNPDLLLKKKPFLRGGNTSRPADSNNGKSVSSNTTITASLPNIKRNIVTQDKFAKELDPMCHDVLFDENLPSICVKIKDGYQEIKFQRSAIALQQQILDSSFVYLCGNRCEISLRGANPSEKQELNFASLKEYWLDRNMDGMRTKAVYTQLSQGDAGLLFYFDYKDSIKCRLLSYNDGYVIVSHNDQNGDRMLECVYYVNEDDTRCIDAYGDKYLYRLTDIVDETNGGWGVREIIPHGFSEIPLVTKRGDVAWNNAQSLIEIYEIIYNIFLVIQKRHGWGILYIKGNINQSLKKIAGSIILQDTSLNENSSVEFKAPPSPEGMIQALDNLFEKIQIASACTFLLPKDVKSSGDISGLAITLTRDLDLKKAKRGVIEWQNFADKMMRLFKEGLAQELVKKGINPLAVTDFEDLHVSCSFKVWQPFSETEYNNMLISLYGAGIISRKTAVETNTISRPDELMRINNEDDDTNNIQEP